MGRSSGDRSLRGIRLVGYDRRVGTPPVSVQRIWDPSRHAVEPGTHAHDFLVVLYVERGTQVLRVDDRDRTLVTGDAFVIAPGVVVTPPAVHADPEAHVWAVFFPADAVDPDAGLASWRAHPLLAAFGAPGGGAGRRLAVPPPERPVWRELLESLDGELRGRAEGYGDAVRAYLTLLLVRLGRLRVGSGDDDGIEPLLARTLEVIEARFHEAISLSDVAADVGLTPGHLTTVVRERTGRTVAQWILERRMQEARRLLADTELTVADIGHRIGFRDGGYFVRRFRTVHGVPPAAWRRQGA